MAGRHMKFDRNKAVETAMYEYWTHGYSNISVNGLCATLGITRSSFYNTFKSLDNLFEDVVALYMTGAPWKEVAGNSSIAGQGSPTVKIRGGFRQLCKMRAADTDARGCLLVNCVGSFAALSAPAQRTVLTALADGRSDLERNIAEAIELGELPETTDVNVLADALQTLTSGVNNVSKLIPSEDRLWALTSTTLDGLGLRATDGA